MPGWNVHLEAGNRLADRLELSQEPRKEFLFGCLLPDVNNGYINKVKTRKHHYETHYAFDKKSSLNFYAANKAAVDAREPIFLGYLFHLYSDGYFNYDFYRTIKRSPKWSHLNPDEKQDIKHHDFWLYDSKFHHYLQIESPAEMQHLAHLANTIDATDIEPADIADLERVLKYELNTSVVDEPYQFYTEERLEDLVGSTIQSFSHDYLGESYA
ncbi:hypothetical protein IKF04_03110 [Candidatus Saccharibacteria bacterium]|nr:hypothetical protein [Candidatus Saccharibacteria bacterium]